MELDDGEWWSFEMSVPSIDSIEHQNGYNFVKYMMSNSNRGSGAWWCW